MYCMNSPILQPILMKSHTGLLAQSAERRANNANVMSSILIQTNFFFFYIMLSFNYLESGFCCLRHRGGQVVACCFYDQFPEVSVTWVASLGIQRGQSIMLRLRYKHG